MNVEDIWSDFDVIVDLDSVCKATIVDKVNLVNRVASACCMQVINVLYELQKTNDEDLRDTIDKNYDMWRELHSKLLNL